MKIFLWIAFILALTLRFIAMVTPAIWYDEAFSLYVASLPINEIIKFQDFTPPLWELILHPFVMSFPSVITIRFVALVFSMLSIFVAWRITHKMQFTQMQTIICLFILAALPGLVWMGSDGRVYALLSFLYVLGIYFAIESKRTALFIISAIILYTHATGIMLVATLYYYWFIHSKRDGLKEMFYTAMALGVIWSPMFIKTINTNADLFTPLTSEYFLRNFLMSYFIGVPQISLWLVGFFLIAVTMWIGDDDLAWFVAMPMLLLVIASFLTVNLITYRTLSPTLIPFALLVGKTFNEKFPNRIFSVVWIVLLIFSVLHYNFKAKGSDQEEIANTIMQSPSHIVYATLTVALPFDYYLHDLNNCILQVSPDGALMSEYHDFGFTRCTPDQLTPPYWLVIPTDPMIPAQSFAQMNALAEHAELIAEFRYPQISPVKVYKVNQ